MQYIWRKSFKILLCDFFRYIAGLNKRIVDGANPLDMIDLLATIPRG